MTQTPAEPVIRLINVSKSFGEVKVLDNVSLDIREGEFFTLLGPSGSGKTTVLRIIAGLLEPDSGEVLIDGRSVVGMPAYKRGLAVVFQSLALFPHLTVGKNVAFPLRMRRISTSERDRRVKAALSLVQLPDIAERSIAQLSGGQRQRVALARALIYEPRILLLDEPLSALDRRLRESMQLELTRIHQELGVTIINVTHDQREALIVSDRVAVMDKGVVVQCAPGLELYEKPATRFVAGFLGDPFLMEGEVIDNPSGAGRKFVCRNGLVSVSPSATLGRAVAVLRPEMMSLVSEDDGRRTLENSVSGRVSFSTFDGNGTFYQVTLDSGDSVAVHIPARSSSEPKGIGERVRVTWNTADVPLLVGG